MAGDVSNTVVPYGDYCAKCTHYGGESSGGEGFRHPVVMMSEQAEEALMAYFHDRGMGVQHLLGAGRFIRADVVLGNKVIDTVIFDRRTGRIRSIY